LDDEKLTRRVDGALDRIEPVRIVDSPVQINNSVVALRGAVASFLTKAQVLQAVQGVSGIQQVRDEVLTDSEVGT
jgi:osmotically-inducible protein OsmY